MNGTHKRTSTRDALIDHMASDHGIVYAPAPNATRWMMPYEDERREHDALHFQGLADHTHGRSVKDVRR